MWGGAWMFDNWAQYAQNAGYDTYAFDMRGHHQGRNHLDVGKIGIEDYVADAIDVLKVIPKRTAIVGHSLGGLIAQILAYRGHAKKVALVNSVPASRMWLRWPVLKIFCRARYLTAMARNEPVSLDFDDALSLELYRHEKPDVIYQMLVPDSGRVMRQIVFGTVWVPSIPCPGKVFCGLKDKIVPFDLQMKMTEHLNIPSYVDSSHGHLMMLEKGWEDPIQEILNFVN